jgi:hypothetical protein
MRRHCLPSPPPTVAFDVEPQLTGRNRMTVVFRLILAIPHLIIVGGPGFALGGGGWFYMRDGVQAWRFGSGLGGGGVLGVVAFVVAVIAWFAIIFAGNHPRGLWDLTRMYMRWRTKAVAYTALLRDEYPPFGEAEYPVTYESPTRTSRATFGPSASASSISSRTPSCCSS